jgi:transcription initiation factor TFIID subunit 7
MICKEEPDPVTDDEKRDAQKNKKKDPNKIDKKFLYPHGLTPCLKVTLLNSQLNFIITKIL